MNLRFYMIVLAGLAIITPSNFAQNTGTFPLNEDVRHGVLENGMNYYILHNEEPKDRASFYFVQNVGAILEEDSQNGLAHFLEHMAFNGTKHFEGKGIIDFLEQHGVRFGYDINAYTAQDQTVYNLSNIPVNDSEGLLDSCLLVMHDWSGYLSLLPEEIESERGVIHEEWRTRRNSQFRLNSQTSKVLYKNSKYADRDVIGDLDVIDNFKHDELRSYYQKWYRPDQQAVVVVGDIDVDEVEKKVIDRFSPIPLREGLPEREVFSIPDNDELLFGKATDPEAQFMAILMIYKSDAPLVQNEETFKKSMMENLYSSMANMRLMAYQQDPESNSLMLMTAGFPLARLHKGFILQAIPKPGKGKESFREIFTEVQGITNNGFTEAELQRAKDQINSQLDNFIENKDQITSDNWATQLGSHFLQGEPVFKPEQEYQLSKETLDNISLDDMNAFAKTLQTEKNQILLVTGPDKEGTVYPTEEELKAVIQEVSNKEIDAYVDETGDQELISDDLKGSEILAEFSITGIPEAKGYTLTNGAKVILMPTDYEEDQILMSAFSYGGTSKLSVEDLPSADMATSLAQYSGLGEFDMIGLQKKLAGKLGRANPFINKYTEGISGSTNKKDQETMFQLTYLHFTHPRFDEKSFQVLQSQMTTLLENSKADNNQALSDTIAMLTTNHSPRTILFNQDLLDKMSFDKAAKVYKDRFDNVGDFTFILVGNLTNETLDLVKKYIGSIPGTPEEEQFVDHNIGPAKGKTTMHFERQMEVAKTTVYTRISGKMDYNLINSLSVNIIGKLLDKRYMETIREEEGGSYGVSVGGSLSRIPSSEFNLTITFDTDPDKRSRLNEIVWSEINKIKDNGPDLSDLEEVKRSFIKLRKEQLDKNGFWMGSIQNSLMTGIDFLNLEAYTERVNSIDAATIQETMVSMMSDPDVVEVMMNPKK
jgi:zinc protease